VRSGHYADERAYDVLLGIGPNRHQASIRAAEHIEETAARFDVRIATNEWFVKVANDDSLTVEVNPDGTIVFNGFTRAPRNVPGASPSGCPSMPASGGSRASRSHLPARRARSAPE